MEINEKLKIEIRPIPNKNNIREFSENLEFFSQANTISPFVNPVTLKYDTGLSKEDIKYLESQKFPYELNDNFVRGHIHPFWESELVKVNLLNTPTFLHPGKSLIDFIKWRYLLKSKYVYSSEEEMKTGSKPQATHYIYNENVEMDIKASRLEKRNTLLKKISSISLNQKRNIILVLLDEDVTNKNENYVNVRIDEMLNNSKATALLEDFLTNSSEKINMLGFIKSAIHKNVLRKTRQGIFFFDTNLGFNEEAVYDFLSKDENNEIYLTIKSKIE